MITKDNRQCERVGLINKRGPLSLDESRLCHVRDSWAFDDPFTHALPRGWLGWLEASVQGHHVVEGELSVRVLRVAAWQQASVDDSVKLVDRHS